MASLLKYKKPYLKDCRMTLENAIGFLDSFINHEITPRKYGFEGYIPDRVGKLLAGAGIDTGLLKIVHIAGTKGKGSTAFYASSLIESNGNFKVGLYTSPHVLRINERIKINMESITDREFVRLIENYAPYITGHEGAEKPTYFDVLTFLAMAHFIGNSCDYAVLETGLGGRLDSTNFCLPMVSVITSIGFDHTALLGGTLREIAGEKAGIIKALVPAVTSNLPGEALARVKEEALIKSSPFIYLPECVSYKITERNPAGGIFNFRLETAGQEFVLDNVYFSQRGDVFVENFLLSLLALTAAGLKLSEKGIREAVRKRIPFRMEKRGDCIIDVAHNDSSLDSLFKTIKDYFKPGIVRLYIGILSDKELGRIAEKIIECGDMFDKITVFDFPTPRLSGGKALYEMVSRLPQAFYCPSMPEVSHEKGLVNVFTGSFQTIERVLENIPMERDEYASFLNGPLDIPEWEGIYSEALRLKIPVLRPLSARLLYFVTRLAKPRNILEIGTGSGYSTLWIMRGMGSHARITTFERDKNRFESAGKLFGDNPAVNFIRGDALELLPENEEVFDFVFLDAQKRDYPLYLDILRGRMSKGGILFADNFLYEGHDEKSSGANLMRLFNEELSRGNSFDSLFLSIEDGVVIAIKK
jgi:dihydrofolate synthase/folylpolyglutamate synthase